MEHLHEEADLHAHVTKGHMQLLQVYSQWLDFHVI